MSRESGLNAYARILNMASSHRESSFDFFSFTMHNLDEIYRVDEIAADHETAIGLPIVSPGGSGANTAYALAMLGMNVGVGGAIAADEKGKILLESLRIAKINTRHLIVAQEAPNHYSGRAIVILDGSGSRSIYTYDGVNSQFASLVSSSQVNLNFDAIYPKITHFSSFTSDAEKNFCQNIAMQMPSDSLLAFTPGFLYAKKGLNYITKILLRSNIVFLYERQLQMLVEPIGSWPGEKLETSIGRLFDWCFSNGHHGPLMVSVRRSFARTKPLQGPEYLTISCGASSAEAAIHPQISDLGRVIPFRKEYGLGAGDALAAGIIYGVLKGLPLQEVADVACVLAAYISSAEDARSAVPDEASLLKTVRQLKSCF